MSSKDPKRPAMATLPPAEPQAEPPDRGDLVKELWRLLSDLAGRGRGKGHAHMLEEALRFVAEAVVMALRTSLAVSVWDKGQSEVDAFGLDPDYADRYRPLLEFLFQRYWRIQVQGLEHIPPSGRALIVANHSGALPYDATMIMLAVRVHHPSHRLPRPLVEDFVYHLPFLGTFINRVGGVRACPENGERLLRAEELAVVFPEGIKGIGKVFADRYKLQRFGRGGFVKLAHRTASPIIPTAVVGAEEIHPILFKVSWLARHLSFPYIPVTPTFPLLGPLGLLPLPTRWTIRFGEPIMLDYENQELGENSTAIHRQAEEVRGRIQGMVDELVQGRSSIFF